MAGRRQHYYGDYLARGWSHGSESGWIQLYFVDGAQYCKFQLWTEMEVTGASAESWRLMQQFVLQDILPALGASGVRDSYEID